MDFVSTGVFHLKRQAEVGCRVFFFIVVTVVDQRFDRLVPISQRSTTVFPPGVIEIGKEAFAACSQLTSISLPSTVTTLGENLFEESSRLESIYVAPGNPHFSSIDGLLLSGTGDKLLQCPEGRTGPLTIPAGVTTVGASACRDCVHLTEVTIPPGVTTIESRAFKACERVHRFSIAESVTSIGAFAFQGCDWLNRITIPSQLESIGSYAFSGCDDLIAAFFLGKAPLLGTDVFIGSKPEFAVFFLSSQTGFTYPEWNGYPSREIDEGAHPAAAWLLRHGYWHDHDLDQDPNRDGVSLLMGYALNLDPRRNLQGRLPVPLIEADHISVTFYGAQPGITYSVQTSEDLEDWTSTGVILSDPDLDGIRIGSVVRDSPSRFLRLVVEAD